MSDMINCIASKADTEEGPCQFGTYSIINNNNNNNNNNGLISVHPWYGSSPDIKVK